MALLLIICHFRWRPADGWLELAGTAVGIAIAFVHSALVFGSLAPWMQWAANASSFFEAPPSPARGNYAFANLLGNALGTGMSLP